MIVPDGYRMAGNLLWPVADVGCLKTIHTCDLEVVYKHCRGFDVVVQAGGNCGVWPAAMAGKFRTVYTFEPDPVNFRCLCVNAPQENVFKFNAALGDKRGTVDLERRDENCGAHLISGDGPIPTLRIDDLALTSCDLIYLDIEGSELAALTGAQVTIDLNRPVVVVEDKGVSTRYGIAKGAVVEWVTSRFGYRAAETVMRDVVLVP